MLFVTTVSFVINYHPGAIKLSISASAQRQSSKSEWNETKNVILPFFKFSHFRFQNAAVKVMLKVATNIVTYLSSTFSPPGISDCISPVLSLTCACYNHKQKNLKFTCFSLKSANGT